MIKLYISLLLVCVLMVDMSNACSSKPCHVCGPRVFDKASHLWNKKFQMSIEKSRPPCFFDSPSQSCNSLYCFTMVNVSYPAEIAAIQQLTMDNIQSKSVTLMRGCIKIMPSPQIFQSITTKTEMIFIGVFIESKDNGNRDSVIEIINKYRDNYLPTCRICKSHTNIRAKGTMPTDDQCFQLDKIKTELCYGFCYNVVFYDKESEIIKGVQKGCIPLIKTNDFLKNKNIKREGIDKVRMYIPTTHYHESVWNFCASPFVYVCNKKQFLFTYAGVTKRIQKVNELMRKYHKCAECNSVSDLYCEDPGNSSEPYNGVICEGSCYIFYKKTKQGPMYQRGCLVQKYNLLGKSNLIQYVEQSIRNITVSYIKNKNGELEYVIDYCTGDNCNMLNKEEFQNKTLAKISEAESSIDDEPTLDGEPNEEEVVTTTTSSAAINPRSSDGDDQVGVEGEDINGDLEYIDDIDYMGYEKETAVFEDDDEDNKDVENLMMGLKQSDKEDTKSMWNINIIYFVIAAVVVGYFVYKNRQEKKQIIDSINNKPKVDKSSMMGNYSEFSQGQVKSEIY